MQFKRPGDHVFWRSDGQQRHAIVQSVNAAQRTAAIFYPDPRTYDLASLLELDPHGVRDITTADQFSVRDALGVHRGDFVFVHRAGTTNGLPKPRVPYIGELEAWVRDPIFTSDARLSGWRLEMSEIGKRFAERSKSGIRCLRKGDSSLSWFGEVTEVRRAVLSKFIV